MKWNEMKWNDTKLHDKNSSIYQDKILIEIITQAHNLSLSLNHWGKLAVKKEIIYIKSILQLI